MHHQALWNESIFRETILIVIAFLLTLAVVLYVLQSRSPRFVTAWASLKSWLFAAPVLLLVFGLPSPWPLMALVLVSIAACKTFFRMTGMYHRSWFVWSTYLYSIFLGFSIYYDWPLLYNLSPMLFLWAIAHIPVIRNSATHMIQYIALSLLAFLFFGWAFLHMGRLLRFEQGIYLMMYIYILAEFCEGVSYAANRAYGRVKLFDRITSRVSIEGIFTAMVMTLVLAWALRHMLYNRATEYWFAAGLVASLFGRTGDLILSALRRDLGIKQSGVFIIGRDDILARVDKLVFTAPIFYYVLLLLDTLHITT